MSDVEELLLENGYEGVKYLTDFSYDTALIGVSDTGCTVYDYGKMVEWLMTTQGFNDTEAVEWVDYNTVRALPYMGDGAPIIVYPLVQ